MKIIVQTDSVSELKEMAQQILGVFEAEESDHLKTEIRENFTKSDSKMQKTVAEASESMEDKPAKVTPIQPVEKAITETVPDEPPFDTDENNVPELSEVRLAVKALQEAVGKEQTKEILAKYKAKGASSVPEESRADFIKDAMEVING